MINPTYIFLDEIASSKEIYKCNSTEECGSCSKLFHEVNGLHWHGTRGTLFKSERPVHYAKEAEKTYWTVGHPKKYLIVECHDNCACRIAGTCKNFAIANMIQNPHAFVRDFK